MSGGRSFHGRVTFAAVSAGVRSVWEFLFAALLLCCATVVMVPFAPGMPLDGLDPSWEFGMNQALAQGLVFGRDIVFTFGPYASIYTKLYHPATDSLMLYGALYLGASFFVVAYLVFRRAAWQLQLALLVMLSSVLYTRDALLFGYALLVGLQVYRLTLTTGDDQATQRWVAVQLVVLFAPFGLLPLIKGSALIACVALAALSGAMLALRQQWRLVALVAGVPLIAMMLFWMLARQPLGALPGYFIALAPIVGGYTDAMSVSGNAREWWLFLLAAVLVVVTIAREAPGSLAARLLLTSMFGCVLFLSFKAGFVRHDGHAVIAGTMILLVALLAGTVASRRSAVTVFAAGLVSWLIIDAAHIQTSTRAVLANTKAAYVNAWTGFVRRVAEPDSLQAEFTNRVTELATRAALPPLAGTVDIYSYDQSYLIASGNQWHPRPVLQSYSAYADSLALRNRDHLRGEDRPAHVIFRLQPIDRRLPALEDGISWPALLSGYRATGMLNGYLHLQRRETAAELTDSGSAAEWQTHRLGERIPLPDSNAVLLARIELHNSLAGRLMNTLYKPGQLEITVGLAGGVQRQYRLIAGMAEAGFVVSPLIENTNELALLFAGTDHVADKQVEFISVQAVNLPWTWQDGFRVQFQPEAYQAEPDVVAAFGFTRPEPLAAEMQFLPAASCDGSIDYLNGSSPAPAAFRAASALDINGWLAASVELAEVPQRVYLVLTDTAGRRLLAPVQRTARPDVGAYFRKEPLNASGFAATIDVSGLQGDYVLGLAYASGETLFQCPQFAVTATLGRE